MKLHTIALVAALTTPVFAQQPAAATSGAASADDSTKIIALNSIMSADPDRGMPLLEGILKGTGSASLKERAMSLLTQSRSPRAQQVLMDYAKTPANPDLQLRAVRTIGRAGTKENQQLLAGIYSTAADARVKQEIIRSLVNSGDTDAVLAITKSEKDTNLRGQAIRDLTNSENTPVAALTGFYASETDPSARRSVINGLAGRGDVKTIIELARKESDSSMKVYIVQRLGGMKNKEATDFMVELLK